MLAEQSADSYGLAVVEEWKKMQLFEFVTLTNQQPVPVVDAVIRLTIRGDWKTSPFVGDLASAILVGASLGLLASVIPSETWTGTHEAIAIINKTDKDEIGRYAVQVTSTVENARHFIFGEGPNKQDAENANQMQVKRIAHELATKIRADRQTLVQQLRK